MNSKTQFLALKLSDTLYEDQESLQKHRDNMKVYTDTCPQKRSDSETTHTAAVSERCRSRFSETIKYRWTDAVVVLAQFPCIFCLTLTWEEVAGGGETQQFTFFFIRKKKKIKYARCKDHSRAQACVTCMEMGV